jgi:DNA-binding GntR family transcriptional regulator
VSSIARAPLREQVHGEVVRRIVRDELRPGERLSDAALAGELGMSRTPVREALVQLEQEGFLESDVGRGFFVKPLSAREAAEVYVLAATLEVLALRLSPSHPAATLALLSRLDRELARADDDPVRRVELDAAWHAALVKDCGNRLLLGSLASLRATVQRYELARARAVPAEPPSRAHGAIAAALAEGDAARAPALLQAHWRQMAEGVDGWLADRALSAGFDAEPSSGFDASAGGREAR